MATLPFLTSFNILMNISRNFLNFCVISDQMHVAIDLSLHFVIWKLLYCTTYTPIWFQPSLKKLILCACLNQDRTPKEFTASVALCTMTRFDQQRDQSVTIANTIRDLDSSVRVLQSHPCRNFSDPKKWKSHRPHTKPHHLDSRKKKHNSVFKRASSPVIVYVGGHSYYVFF